VAGKGDWFSYWNGLPDFSVFAVVLTVSANRFLTMAYANADPGINAVCL